MVYNTLTIVTAVTPTVIETYLSHYLNRKSLQQKPTAHISYHEGINLIRQFLHYASLHTVEDLQDFTAQWVPHPRWVKVDEVTIPNDVITKSGDLLEAQLGHHGIDKIGGRKWWQWRREGSVLKAEWIEMRKDYTSRKQMGDKGKRVMLYVHGGAYYFGSVDEHRYQMQRHARKLKARVFARMLVTLRDRGLPLPAGAILISPWVDLTHSFPSVAGDNTLDYIPAHGFMHRPSAAWPPPNSDEMEQIAMHAVETVVGEVLPRMSTQHERQEAMEEARVRFKVEHVPETLYPDHNDGNPDLFVKLDGKVVRIKDQIQMYATNQLISHPLVSPALQPSLGGLPPLLVMTGGGEILRDEQIYIAHKAANPAKYPPSDAYLEEHPEARDIIDKWKPTDVQLQVWEDLCHVAPTLSFTRPAKYMYRSIAQFGAWALARAQKSEIEIQDDDEVSVISEESAEGTDSEIDLMKSREDKTTTYSGAVDCQAGPIGKVGRAGDTLPSFRLNMIRQRVDRHGHIYPLGLASSLPGLRMSPNEIGFIKPGPVRKWLEAKTRWDHKYARDKRKVQKQRVKEMARGFEEIGDDEAPPPSALARRIGKDMPKEGKKTKSMGLSLWSLWGSSHDEKTIVREEKADGDLDPQMVTSERGDSAGSVGKNESHGPQSPRSRSHSRVVTDEGQTTSTTNPMDETAISTFNPIDGTTTRQPQPQPQQTQPHPQPARSSGHPPSPTSMPLPHTIHPANPSTIDTSNPRPTASGVAFPFTLGRDLSSPSPNASMITLTSHAGAMTPQGDSSERADGYEDGEGGVGREKRPVVERFETARESV